MIKRKLESVIADRLFKGKAIILLGPRQTGKTTLLREVVKGLTHDVLWLDADEPIVRNELSGVNISGLKNLIGKNKILVIDEAQQIKNIGQTLKLITDHIREVQLLVSGSSALELAEEITEPLTGRKFEFFLYPVSFEELVDDHGWIEEKSHLQQRLIFGSYPEVVSSPDNMKETLTLLAGSYLYKDIFKYKDLRRPELLESLLQALALQLGSQVSYHELSQIIGADTETVQRYIELLEKTYVIFRLRSFSRNLRNELKKSRKIYFYDNGIRNALINHFSPFNLRTDQGALWENYLISERMKFLNYNGLIANKYFWRTQQQQEIDYLEECDGILHAYEFKWGNNSRARIPLTFSNAYPRFSFDLVTPENMDLFLKGQVHSVTG
jgi:predicted AAA+ superfamily ATPase